MIYQSIESLTGGSVLATLSAWLTGFSTPKRVMVPASTASMYVRPRGSLTATVDVFPNDDGTGAPLSQPLAPDADGRFPGFVAQPAELDLVVSGPGLMPRTIAAGLARDAVTITDTHVVGSQAAMLAISGAHEGTVAIRTDLDNAAFIHNAGTAGTIADWTEISFGAIVPGTDGKVGGPGGTALTNAVVSVWSLAGHPTTGTWATDQAVIDANGTVWICTAGGTPGMWAEGASGGSTPTVVAAGNLGSSHTLTVANPETWMTGTLNANCALTISGLAAGDGGALFITQDATGSRTLTVNDGSGAVSVTVNSAANATTTIAFEYDGTTLHLSNGILASTDLTDSASLVRLTTAQTLTNKRITNRVVAVTQSATPAINTDNTDVANITGLAQAITSMTTNLTGTPVDGDFLVVRITDNGTGRALAWGASFEASTISLPTTTVASTLLTTTFQYNGVTSKFRCVGVA